MDEVEYVAKADIEAAADRLRAEYARHCGGCVQFPTPVDEIIESHLDLNLHYTDLKGRCGGVEVRGAICVGEMTIWIDESLEPDSHPEQEGVQRFTAAHEAGHWMLHRKHLPVTDAPGMDGGPSSSSVNWSVSHGRRYNRIEHQANIFAGALLMPTDAVMRHWRRMFGHDRMVDASEEFRALGGGCGDFEPVVGPAEKLAAPFKVSGFAMQIRLKRMNLLRLDAPTRPNTFVVQALSAVAAQ